MISRFSSSLPAESGTVGVRVGIVATGRDRDALP